MMNVPGALSRRTRRDQLVMWIDFPRLHRDSQVLSALSEKYNHQRHRSLPRLLKPRDLLRKKTSLPVSGSMSNKRRKPANGIVVYKGPSQLDGQPIVVILTGIRESSENIKTGAMLQTWILREDMAPQEAIKAGADYSICGDCKHRGESQRTRTCYVLAFQAPTTVWNAYHHGSYLTDWNDKALAKVQGRPLRLGSYGDPTAVPADVWADLVMAVRPQKVAGYTHQWSRPEFQSFSCILMASVDTSEEREQAKALGWRTFRTRTPLESVETGEVICPASEEGGKLASCERCGLCAGQSSKAKDPTIIVHGNTPKVRRLLKMAG